MRTKLQVNLEEIEDEIAHYNPPLRVAKIMREAANLGFTFSGHGVGFGDEDWTLDLDYKTGSIYLDVHRKSKNINIHLTVLDLSIKLKDIKELKPLITRYCKIIDSIDDLQKNFKVL